MPYYALINGKHATPGLSSEEAILDFVKKGAERNVWPKMKDDDRNKYMIEIYDMEYQKNGTQKLINKYFWIDGEIEEAHESSKLLHTQGRHVVDKLFGLRDLQADMNDPEKLFVDIAVIEDPTTSTEDGSFAMNFDKAYMSEDGGEDGEEHHITRINDPSMFKIIIDAVSKDFVDNRLDGKSILKIEYGVHGRSFMDEDTYVRGWIYDREGQLIEQHGYPRQGW